MNWVLTALSPIQLLLLLVGAAAVVALLYLLRERRRQVEVPWLALWQEALAESEGSAWWRHLRRLLSAVLIFVLFALLLLALADPRPASSQEDARHVIVLIDDSASMQARDGERGETRLQTAQRRAQELLESRPAQDRMMFATLAGGTQVISGFGATREESLAALDTIEATDLSAPLIPALHWAKRTAGEYANATIVLLTDGIAEDRDEVERYLGSTDAENLSLHAIGSAADNVAVTDLRARPYPADPSLWEVMIAVENFSSVPAEIMLEVSSAGQEILRTEFYLDAGQRTLRTISDVPATGGTMQAQATVTSGVIDQLPSDNLAYLTLESNRRLRVALVGDVSLYVEGPLLLNESLVVTRRSEEHIDEYLDSTDLFVFEGTSPAMPATAAIYIAPRGDTSPWETAGAIEDPIIDSITRDHPVLRYISSLRETNVQSATPLVVGDGDTVLASSVGGRPMLAIGERGGHPSAAFAFEPDLSDLPLRVSWPILMQNLVDWFAGQQRGVAEGLQAGSIIEQEFADSEEGTPVVLHGPEGGHQELGTLPASRRVSFRVTRAGIYRLEVEGNASEIAVNTARHSESRIGNVITEVRGETDEAATPRRLLPSSTPWWSLVAVVCALLLVEWWTWQRRMTV